MRSYSVAEAEDHLQEMLDRVRSGETILVTEGGKPLAELIPMGETKSDLHSETARKLEELRSLFKGLTLADMLSARHEGHES